MSKRVVISLGVAAVVAGGLYMAGDYLLARAAEQFVDSFQKGLPEGTTLSYDRMESNLLARQVTLGNLKIRAPAGAITYTLTAGEVSLQGVPLPGAGSVTLGHLSASKLQIGFGNEIGAEAASFDGINLHPGGVSFSGGDVAGFYLRGAVGPTLVQATTVKLGALQDNILSSLVTDGLQLRLNPEEVNHLAEVRHVEAKTINLPALMEARSNPRSLLLRDTLGEVSLSGFDLSDGADTRVSVGTLALKGESAGNGYRKNLLLDVTGISLPVQRAPAQVQALMGVNGTASMAPAEFHISILHDPATRLLTLDNARLVMPGQGELQAKGAVSGVSSLMLLENPAGFAAMSFDGFELHYTDLGVVQRRVQAEAERMAITPDVYAEQIINKIGPQMEVLGRRGTQIRGVLYNFISNPRYLSFVAKPAQPVSLLQLAPLLNAPAQLADILGIFASSEPLHTIPASPP